MSEKPEETRGGKGAKRWIIIISAVFLIIVGAIAGGFFLIWNKISTFNSGGADLQQTDESAGPTPTSESASTSVLYPLETFIVNLADDGGKRYLKVRIELEVKDTLEIAGFEKRLAQVRDKILMTLTTKTLEEVITLSGKDTLRRQLIDQLNEFDGRQMITNLYFTEFVIQ
jgi:flagellar FliL protein